MYVIIKMYKKLKYCIITFHIGVKSHSTLNIKLSSFGWLNSFLLLLAEKYLTSRWFSRYEKASQ